MKVAVVGHGTNSLISALKKEDFGVVKKNPEVVIVFGGDGTLLWAEKKYPHISKLHIYHGSKCPISKCKHDFKRIVNRLKNNKFKFKNELKLTVSVKGKKILCLNDVNIHYTPPRALRFKVKVNGRDKTGEIIGDGVVISTPFGSGAYFKSITGKKIKKGIGIAFNNPTKKMKPLFVNANSKIEVTVLRETGVVATDTNPNTIKIKKGNKVIVSKCSKQTGVCSIR